MQLDMIVPFEKKIEIALERFKAFLPSDGQPYIGCFSGGKDSVVIKELGRLSGTKIHWVYNVTTLDPPELLRFIREHHADVEWMKSGNGSLLKMIPAKGMPTRRARWCCEKFKEWYAPIGRRKIFGVRAAESARRATRWKMMSYHTRSKEYILCPIIDWSDAEVWEFIRSRALKYCILYDEGFSRLGCIGCPLASANHRRMEFARWPAHKAAWMRACRDLWVAKTRRGNNSYATHEDLWDWWMDEVTDETDECQGVLGLYF